MNIADIPCRLGLVFGLQMAACVYNVLAVAAFIKTRQALGGTVLLSALDLSWWMKYHGWILFAVPLAWYWFHVRLWVQEGADASYLGLVVASGVAVLALLSLLGFLGTINAIYAPMEPASSS
jgi:hypothetical protein